jgi:hypothetical protein
MYMTNDHYLPQASRGIISQAAFRQRRVKVARSFAATRENAKYRESPFNCLPVELSVSKSNDGVVEADGVFVTGVSETT